MYTLKSCSNDSGILTHLAPHSVLPAVSLRSYTPYLLHRPVAHTNAYHFSFFPDAITYWNTLPTSVLSCNFLCAFKHALTRHIHL